MFEDKQNSLKECHGELEIESITAFSSFIIYLCQRAKMKELAMQRSKQLQKEEEERNRELRAKAFAKLEELNRRSSEKLECNVFQLKQEEHLGGSLSQTHTGGEALGPSVGHSDAGIQASDDVIKIKESMELSLNRSSGDLLTHAPKGSVVAVDQIMQLTSDATSAEFAAETERPVSQFSDGGGQKPKPMGYKRKQNTSHDRNLPDKVAASGITTVQDNMDGSANVLSAESGVPVSANAKDDQPQQQHKKKTNKFAKNKPKLDESLSIATLPSSEPMEESSVKALTEIKKTVTPETVSAAISDKLEASRAAVKALDSQQEGLVSAGNGLLQPAEETHGRTTGHCKAQPHRRVSRNTQSMRPVEKFHGNEGTIWTPVRSPMNKSEPFEESNAHVNMNSGYFSGKNGHAMQSNLTKGKRAEMERYVPKPVAKELSQQESSQVALAPLTHVVSDMEALKSDYDPQSIKNNGKDHSTPGKAGLEVKNAEVKQNKNGKMHASWRQRSPVEYSMGLNNPQEGPSSSSDLSRIIHKPSDQLHNQKADFLSQKEQEKHSDGQNMEPLLQEEVTAPIIVKDHGGAGRGKRQHSRAQRSSGHSHSQNDRKDVEESVDKTDHQLITFGSIDMDARNSARNENQAKVDHASAHWQPKLQAHSVQNRQGRRGNGVQRQFHEKESSHISPKADKDATARVQPHHPDAQKASVEMNDPHHEAAKREKKGVHSSKEHTNAVNRVPLQSTEVVLDNFDTYREELVSSGMRRQGQHGGRFNRAQEVPHGGGRGNSVQDVNKQQMPTNGDRRKHSSHYEYQPVGSYNRPDNSFRQEEVLERPQPMSSRYRERGQNHPRRGGQFYGRHSGGSAVHVATAYANED